jgi:membrane-associated phospholipid phosphatase
MENRKIYDMISLYQYISIVALSIASIGSLNSYLSFVTIFLILNMVPVKFMKLIGFKGVDWMKNLMNVDKFGSESVNNRPSNAYNCNIINQGGDYSEKAGFPSGHSSAASFLFFIVLFEFVDKNNSSEHRKNLIPLLIITFIFGILVPYSRVKMSCHTTTQVIAGIITGCIMSLIFKTLDMNLLRRMDVYRTDKERFLQSLNFTKI